MHLGRAAQPLGTVLEGGESEDCQEKRRTREPRPQLGQGGVMHTHSLIVFSGAPQRDRSAGGAHGAEGDEMSWGTAGGRWPGHCRGGGRRGDARSFSLRVTCTKPVEAPPGACGASRHPEPLRPISAP